MSAVGGPLVTTATLDAAVRELPADVFLKARWFGAKHGAIAAVEPVDAVLLDAADASGSQALLLVVDVRMVDGTSDRYFLPALFGDAIVLGTRASLAVARGLLAAVVAGGDVSGFQGHLACSGEAVLGELPVDAELRKFEADQTNTAGVVAERFLVKGYRRLAAGAINEIEMVEALTRAGFTGVPPAVGDVRYIDAEGRPAGVALVQEYIADAEDGWSWAAEDVRRAATTPGHADCVWAGEIGALCAEMHAVLAAIDRPGLRARTATADDLAGWAATALERFERVLAAEQDLVEVAPSIRRGLQALEQVEPPLLLRIHGDFHLGQVLRSAVGYRFVDFEGQPHADVGAIGRLDTPLRDVAHMLRSFVMVAEWMHLRLIDEGADLDDAAIDQWVTSARGSFLSGYRAVAGEDAVDPSLLRALELEKSIDEFLYAVSYLPSWLPVARRGLRRLLEGRG